MSKVSLRKKMWRIIEVMRNLGQVQKKKEKDYIEHYERVEKRFHDGRGLTTLEDGTPFKVLKVIDKKHIPHIKDVLKKNENFRMTGKKVFVLHEKSPFFKLKELHPPFSVPEDMRLDFAHGWYKRSLIPIYECLFNDVSSNLLFESI